MEINRNQYFMIGLVVLFLGIQFRVTDSFTLNDRATQMVAQRMGDGGSSNILRSVGPAMGRVVQPPDWLGWALMSVGTVLILHSLAMRRPEG